MSHIAQANLRPTSKRMLLAYEPMGELALPSPAGVRLLGIEATGNPRWRALRHVFDIGDDAGLHVDVGPLGETVAYAVAYTIAGDELLTPL